MRKYKDIFFLCMVGVKIFEDSRFGIGLVFMLKMKTYERTENSDSAGVMIIVGNVFVMVKLM